MLLEVTEELVGTKKEGQGQLRTSPGPAGSTAQKDRNSWSAITKWQAHVLTKLR